MKNIIIIIFLFSINFVSSQSSGKVVYEVKLSLSIEDISDRVKKMKKEYINQEVISSLKKMVLNATEQTAILTFLNRKSNYIVEESIDNEGVEGVNVLKSNAGVNKLFYTSINKEKNTTEDCDLLGKCFSVITEKPNWVLTQETKKIGIYTCYKAILKNSKNKIKKPIAWYTTEIPLGFGPKTYYGLPGLILEVEESITLFKAKSIILNPKDKITIKKPKGEEVSEKEYKAILKKSFPDFYKYKK